MPPQVFFSAVIFVLLGSEDGFSREWVQDDTGVLRAPSMYNGAFSTVAFLLGAVTSIASGFLGKLMRQCRIICSSHGGQVQCYIRYEARGGQH